MKIKNNIKLNFNKNTKYLIRYSYGQDVYKTQVKDCIDFSIKNVIVIPNNIQDIGISFVQGFTSNIFKEIGKENFFKYIDIEANEKVKNKFIKSVFL